jgi:predicted DNA-binding ribbon-helix-helix protein
MANVFKVRTTELTGTGRTSLRFEETTWAAIDALAVNRGIRWQDWARDVIAQKPGAPNKSAVIRAALADELLAEQFAALAEESASGTAELNEVHEIVGTGYYRLDDDQLASELASASIITKDDSFGSFVLHIGRRSTSYGGESFVIVENMLKGHLHLMIAPTVES